LSKGGWFLGHQIWSWLVLASSLPKFDAYIFLFGNTITNSRLELWLLKLLRKRMIFVYVGSDARPPFIDGVWFPAGEEPAMAKACAMARRFKQKIRLHERYADFLVNSPSTAQYHEKKFINWFAMGLPKVAPEGHSTRDATGSPRDGSVRILHSPSNPAIKGSLAIVEVVERLRARGHAIELVKIEGVSNEVVLRELARCDFVIDQLYSDTPMAAFATEAAHYGKPAVVGGYFAEEMADAVRPEYIPPSLFVTPETLEAAVERLVVDKDFRETLGQRASEYVNSRWSAVKVAGRYLELIYGRAEAAWWCDPQDVLYVRGCGMPQAHAARMVRALIERYGMASLQVSDKPRLEQAFAELAGRGARSAHD
jgi:glycosyltransferase involved in cell wall biosynthesis